MRRLVPQVRVSGNTVVAGMHIFCTLPRAVPEGALCQHDKQAALSPSCHPIT
jgi:hypothetical protein